LLYVAFTRARERLLVTSAGNPIGVLRLQVLSLSTTGTSRHIRHATTSRS
jgi:hypothetical protein